ncbi:MAG: hypothetical protein Q8R72_14955 [Hylemonella sp.]|nr:hypothetical protein [Hylemonella sp.]
METMNRSARATAMQVRGDFVLLRAGSLHLLLPQHDVNATEYMEHAPDPIGIPGIFSLGEADGEAHLVAALSENMHMLPEIPADRFLLTRLCGERRHFSLAWSEVRVLIDTALELHPLPAILQGKARLIDAYVELDGELAFCTTAQRVLAQVHARPE